MSKHNDFARPQSHANVIVDVNGLPYLLGEYLDRRELQQVDRGAIRSNIVIDDSDAMRAVIDVSVNDIGTRADMRLNITGNNTKQKKILQYIANNAERLDRHLTVLRRGILMRVNYQLENTRNGQVLRSMTEDFRILDRNYFLDINPHDIDDNAVVINFSNSIVSTINDFTHGRDKMLLRITSIQMFYEGVKNGPNHSRIKQSLVSHDFNRPYDVHPEANESYYYHEQVQHQHFLGDPGYGPYGHERVEAISPPTWSAFNRFYHFDADRRDAVLHEQEITDPTCPTFLVPCGNIVVNRTFIINPGHRLIFKFSVWKNDVTVVSDITAIAMALRSEGFYTHEHFQHDHHDTDHDRLVDMLYEERRRNERQERFIQELAGKIGYLEGLLRNALSDKRPDHKHPHHDHKHPNDPEPPMLDDPPFVMPVPDDSTESNDGCGCGCDEEHQELNDRIDRLAEQVSDMDVDAMSADLVEQLWNEVKESQST